MHLPLMRIVPSAAMVQSCSAVPLQSHITIFVPFALFLDRLWLRDVLVGAAYRVLGRVGEAGEPADVDLDGLAVVGGDEDRAPDPDWSRGICL